MTFEQKHRTHLEVKTTETDRLWPHHYYAPTLQCLSGKQFTCATHLAVLFTLLTLKSAICAPGTAWVQHLHIYGGVQEVFSVIGRTAFMRNYFESKNKTQQQEILKDSTKSLTPDKNIERFVENRMISKELIPAVPKSFYSDIFDISSPNSHGNSFVLDNKDPNIKLSLTKVQDVQKTFKIPKSVQPFRKQILTSYTKHTGIEGFVSQTLGNIELAKRSSKSFLPSLPSHHITGPLGAFTKELHDADQQIQSQADTFSESDLVPFSDLDHNRQGNQFKRTHHDPHLPKETLTKNLLTQDGVYDAEGSVGGGQSSVTVHHPPRERLQTHGCLSSDGVWYSGNSVWFSDGCQKHTCLLLRGRYFVETDSCQVVIHNTSYQCLVLQDKEAPYPNCCPRYHCHTDA